MQKGFKKALFVGLLTIGVSGTAIAELDGEKLYKSPAKGGCMACHGKDANTPILPTYPKLAGQNEAYLLQQLKDIQSGARNNGQTAAMKGIMHMVNDEEMAAIAKWLSSQK
jgi:cytochrome c